VKVLATAPGDARVNVSAQAPAGWTVTPSPTDLTLDSGGTLAEGTVVLSVTVPAGASDGSYEVAETVSSAGVPAVRAVATVLVAPLPTSRQVRQPSCRGSWMWAAR